MKKEAINQSIKHLKKSMLPLDMQWVVDAIGMRDTFILIIKLGGIRIHIPCPKNMEASKDSKLMMQALEKQQFQNLCNELGGVTISIPMVQSLAKQVLPTIVRKEFTGDNTKELALKYGISQRTVENYVHMNREKKEIII